MAITNRTTIQKLLWPVTAIVALGSWVLWRRHSRAARAERLALSDATHLVQLLREGQVSAQELVDIYIERIERLDVHLNAVVVRCFDQARQAARRADRLRENGELLGPLHGLPITVKEEMPVAGLPTSCGRPEWKGQLASQTCRAVQRLEQAGAILLGKTNVPTGCLDWQTYNDVYGATTNPWSIAHSAGGSSGGSAAAVCAGLSALELGGDSAGSIRVPALFCGVVGLCTTLGRVPTDRGSRPSSGYVVYGPLARSVQDCALALSVLAGGTTARACREQGKEVRCCDLKGVRLGLWWELPNEPMATLSADVRRAVAAVQEAVRAAGAVVDVLQSPRGIDAARSFAVYMNLIKGSIPGDDPSRAELCAAWDSVFQGDAEHEGYDAVLMPVTISTAFTNDHARGQNALTQGRLVLVDGVQRRYSDHYFWPHFAIAARLPAVAIPTGLTAGAGAALPVGVQVLCRSGEDERALDIGRRVMLACGLERAPRPSLPK